MDLLKPKSTKVSLSSTHIIVIIIIIMFYFQSQIFLHDAMS